MHTSKLRHSLLALAASAALLGGAWAQPAPAASATEKAAAASAPAAAAPVASAAASAGAGSLSSASQALVKSITDGVDAKVSPRADFYNHVNGQWMATTTIPADKPGWGAFDEIAEATDVQSLALLEQMRTGKVDTAAAPHEAKLVQALYGSYMDMDARNAAGLKPLQPQLEQITAIADLKSLQKYLEAATPTGDNVLFGWGVDADLKRSSHNAVYLGPAGLGLGKDYYQTASAANKEMLGKYQQYVEQVLTAIDEPNAAQTAARIVAWETQAAKSMLTAVEERDPKRLYNPRSIQQVAGLSRNLRMADYLKNIGVDTDRVIVSDTRFFAAFDKLVNAGQLPLLKSYLRFRLASGAAPFLDERMDKMRFDFYGKTLNGQQEQRALAKRGLNQVNGLLGEAFGRYYVQAYFPARAKTDMLEMVDALITAYGQRIDHLSWMSDATKAKAREKLGKITVKIGYPDKWRDYSSLTLRTAAEGGSLYDNVSRAAQFEYQRQLKKVGQPVDRSEWGMPPQIVNAYYNPTNNEIVFPAGILQPPFYDWRVDAAANFGAIGAVIGHEITHGFDDEGSQYDGDGNLNDWWTAQDRKRFGELTKRMVAQAAAYEALPGEHVNGELTLGENLADLGGVAIAHDALEAYLKTHPQPAELDGLTQSQRFYMAWTRAWRSLDRKEALLNQLRTDPHPPGAFRAVNPVLNTDGFHQAWGTHAGDAMWRDPKDRLTVW